MADKKGKNGGQGAVQQRTVNWEDSNMQTSYANVCNVAGTREEVNLLFGTNQTWQAGQSELTIKLSNRIVLNAYAAKRLWFLLDKTIKNYESSYGEIVIDHLTQPHVDPTET
jgi:hypothetical protein